MKTIATDKWVDFAIKNQEEFKAILEIYKDAEKKIADVCYTAVYRIVKDFFSENLNSEIYNLDNEEGEVTVTPSDYKEHGVYFGYEGAPDWDALHQMERDDLPWFFIYVKEVGKTKKANKQQITEIQGFVESQKVMLKRFGMEISPNDDDGQYLACCFLNNEINFKTIIDADLFEKLINEALQRSFEGFEKFLEVVRKSRK